MLILTIYFLSLPKPSESTLYALNFSGINFFCGVQSEPRKAHEKDFLAMKASSIHSSKFPSTQKWIKTENSNLQDLKTQVNNNSQFFQQFQKALH